MAIPHSKPDRFSQVIEVPLRFKGADRDLLEAALMAMADGGLPVRASVDEESGAITLSAPDERVLDGALRTLQAQFGESVGFGAPQIAYRASILHSVRCDYAHKAPLPDGGEFARVALTLWPVFPAAGANVHIVFEVELPDREMARAIERGIRSAAAEVSTGLPVIAITATVSDAAWHETESPPGAFEIAARAAMSEGLAAAEIVILEPILSVALVVPQDCALWVAEDLRSRRGTLQSETPEGQETGLTALVPAVNMLGYENSLRILSAHRGRYATRLDHYSEVPWDDDDFPMEMAKRA